MNDQFNDAFLTTTAITTFSDNFFLAETAITEVTQTFSKRL